MTTASDLERIVEGPGTKAARARQLIQLGCDRSDVVELLDMSYSQAHSIWKEQHGSGDSRGDRASETVVRRSRSQSERADRVDGSDGRSVESRDASSTPRRPLVLSPAQVRVATQDGHRVVKVDTHTGVRCRTCDRELAYSLRYLAFVHKHSTEEPTDLEDRYE